MTQSTKRKCTQYNVTAIIRNKKGYALSVGKNSYAKTHPIMDKITKHKHTPKIQAFIHAEVDAIVKCRNIKDAYSIEVYNYTERGDAAMSKPCPLCMSLINKTPIRVIKYHDREENQHTIKRRKGQEFC
jgi:deoxycytidylate deaminase